MEKIIYIKRNIITMCECIYTLWVIIFNGDWKRNENKFLVELDGAITDNERKNFFNNRTSSRFPTLGCLTTVASGHIVCVYRLLIPIQRLGLCVIPLCPLCPKTVGHNGKTVCYSALTDVTVYIFTVTIYLSPSIRNRAGEPFALMDGYGTIVLWFFVMNWQALV